MKKRTYRLVSARSRACFLCCIILILQLLSGCKQNLNAHTESDWQRLVVQINFEWYAPFTEFYVFHPTGALEIYSAGYCPADKTDEINALTAQVLPGYEAEETRTLTQEAQRELSDLIRGISPEGSLLEIPRPDDLASLTNMVHDGTIEIFLYLDGQTASFYDNEAIRRQLDGYPQEEYLDFLRFVMSFKHYNYESSMEELLGSFA